MEIISEKYHLLTKITCKTQVVGMNWRSVLAGHGGPNRYTLQEQL